MESTLARESHWEWMKRIQRSNKYSNGKAVPVKDPTIRPLEMKKKLPAVVDPTKNELLKISTQATMDSFIRPKSELFDEEFRKMTLN